MLFGSELREHATKAEHPKKRNNGFTLAPQAKRPPTYSVEIGAQRSGAIADIDPRVRKLSEVANGATADS